MAIWYVDSAAAGTNDGTSWTNAWTALGSAFTNVTTAGDVIYISHTHNEQLAADQGLTVQADHVLGSPLRVYSVNKTNDTLTPGAFIGHDTLNRGITITEAADYKELYVDGVTFQVAGSTADSINIAPIGRQQITFVNCKFYLLNTSSTARIFCGYTSTGRACSVNFIGCDVRFGHTSQGIESRSMAASLTFIDCTMSSGSTHPNVLFNHSSTALRAKLIGCDCSNISVFSNGATAWITTLTLQQCKMQSGFSFFTATTPALDLVHATALDCGVGDQQGYLSFADTYGSVQMETGIYCNDNISDNLSWKITSTSVCSPYYAFVSPWISVYHDGVSAITPYIEILRSGSATPFDDDEVWAEWMYKGTSGSTRGTVGSDRCLPLGTPANQTASSKVAADWTGENATSWFGKLGPSSSITPAEAGDLSFRICVGVASTTVYVDPQIRGLA